MTDKYENGLIPIYEQMFKGFKTKPIDLLEIGVLNGESLDYFAKYFTNPNTRITGVDIKLPKKRKDPRITLIEKDQRDETLSELKADIIIDDASHDAIYTETTFNILWSSVKPGGIYVIEDWHGKVLPEMEDLIIKLMKETPGNKVLFRNDKPLGAVAFFYKGEI